MNDTMRLDKQQNRYPPGVFVKVYVTSKRIHAAELLDLRKDWPHLEFTARWPVVRDIASEQSRPARFWIGDNVDDMLRSDVVLCHAAEEDDLNGSIFELGAAWMARKPIYLSGYGVNLRYKEWALADGIHRFKGLGAALEAITRTIEYRPSHSEIIETRIREIAIEVGEVKRRLELGR